MKFKMPMPQPNGLMRLLLLVFCLIGLNALSFAQSANGGTIVIPDYPDWGSLNWKGIFTEGATWVTAAFTAVFMLMSQIFPATAKYRDTIKYFVVGTLIAVGLSLGLGFPGILSAIGSIVGYFSYKAIRIVKDTGPTYSQEELDAATAAKAEKMSKTS